ncbi:MAG: hypothetical protein WC331_10590 [Candidatus Omnitrophota bacterium]|jgi:hypothetical protein
MTSREATAKVKKYLDEKGIAHGKVSGRMVNFEDLARGAAIFVKVELRDPSRYYDLKNLAKEHGFFVDIV